MATVASDTFTDTNGTNVSAHTPDSGGSWSVVNGATSVIFSNAARGASGTFSYMVHSAAASTDNETCTINWTLKTALATGAIVRYNASGGHNYYFGRYNPTGNVLEFWRVIAGALTLLKNTTGFTPSGTQDFTLKASGTGATVTLEILVDGVSKDTYADTHANRITTFGKGGFTHGSAGADTTGLHINTFTFTDDAGGGGTASLVLPRAGMAHRSLITF